MSEEGDRRKHRREEAPNDVRPTRLKLNHGELDESALVDRMRGDDPRALDEFIIRHQRLLFERARLAGIRWRDCEDHVIQVVEEVGTLIVAHRIRPKALSAYIVKCFFNRWADVAKEATRRRRVVHENADEAPGGGERVVMSLVSEESIRDSHGPGWECVPLAEPLRRLASMIDEELSAEDRELLAWHSRYIPLRQVASWLEVSYATAAKRSWRLRERLREVATRLALTFSPTERRQLADFFDRCAVTYDRGLRSGTSDDSSTRSA